MLRRFSKHYVVESGSAKPMTRVGESVDANGTVRGSGRVIWAAFVRELANGTVTPPELGR